MEEVRQHIVAVAGANQPMDGQPHAPGVIPRQDVAKVARGHHEIHLIAHGNGSGLQQVGIGAEVVDDLRRQAAKVDAVGRGKHLAPLVHFIGKILGGEERLDARLRIVKVALHRDDVGVASTGGGHLQLLHGAHAVHGVEHRAAGAGHILEALQGCLARVAAGGHQDADLPRFAVFPGGEGRQMGQQLQRHVLEGQSRPMEQLQDEGVLPQGLQRGDGRIVKLVGGVGAIDGRIDFGDGEILQKGAQDGRGALAVVHAGQLSQLLAGDGRKHGRHVEAAIGGQAMQDGLGRRNACAPAGGEEGHGNHAPMMIWQRSKKGRRKHAAVLPMAGRRKLR